MKPAPQTPARSPQHNLPASTNMPVTPPRIGLFGGTFDPVHLGHMHLADLARLSLHLDEVRFLPCRISPHKSTAPPTPAGDRLELLHRATRDLPWAVVDDWELTSQAPSYSVLTAKAIAASHPGARLFWIMGADQWDALPCWRDPAVLASLVEFIVLARGGQQPVPRRGYHLHTVHGEHPASATAIRAAARDGDLKDEWLHPKVASWIQQNGLYEWPMHKKTTD